MPRYRDPAGTPGRVVFGGVEFIDGLTGDFTSGESTLELFASAGITEIPGPQLSPKEALQVEAAELGLDTEGTKAEIQARITEHRTAVADDTEE
ncbi:SAP domain-containing protein [Leucobacter sp. GX24907]